MKKRILFLITTCLMIVMLMACNAKVEDDLKDISTIQNVVELEGNSNTKENKELLEKILVNYVVNSFANESEQIMQVDIKNTSDKIFSGKVYIDFLDNEGENITEGGNMIGEDIVDVKELKPGNTIFCNVNVKSIPEDNIYMNHSFADGFNFAEDEIEEGKLNENLAIKLAEDLKDSFGNEYFTAEWYPSIKLIEAYTTDDNINYMVAIVTNDGNEIGNILFGNYVFGDSADFNKVIVVDEENNVIFTKAK